MKKLLPFLIVLLTHVFFVFSAKTQSTVTIHSVNLKKEAVPYSTVTLINAMDSSRVKEVADSTGTAVFRQIAPGQYIVSISAINYQLFEKGIVVTSNQTLTFTLEAEGKTLGGVVVRSSKPLMRQEDDMTIVDPENLVASSTSGYEVIEKTPGLFVDQDGNIYISSLTPATVHINGREMKMSAADVATMLKSLPPNSIDKIEILRTPSAKYDASGSGGIVNVVLKKGVRIGMTGSITGGIQQGTYGNQFLGFNLNNTEGPKSTYLTLNAANRNSYEKIVTDRIFAPDSMLRQNAYTKYPSQAYFGSYGISYEWNKKLTTSYDGRVSFNDFNNVTDNYSTIQKISTTQNLSENLNQVENDGSSLTMNHGVSSRFKIDSAGSEWSTDASYTYSRNQSDQVFSSNFYSPLIFTTGGDGKALNKRHFITAQTDLRLKLKNAFTVEAGLKTSILNFRSVTDYYREINGSRNKDAARTNTFKYRENINSVYLQGTKTIKSIVIKFGTRLENTNMNGTQIIPGDTSFTVHRTDLFPYVYLSRKIMKIAGFELRGYLVYRRSISRPVYEQLNPFARYVDQYLSETGNPALKPQFTSNYEANISVDERPILAVGFNDTRDIFTNVIYQADSSRTQTYRTYDNLGSNKEWYFRGLGAIPPGGKYFFVLGAQYNYTMYDGVYQNEPLRFNRGTWTLFTYHQLKLGTRSQFTMHGFVRFKGQQQLYELSEFGMLSANINRQFLDRKLTVTLSINDIFASFKNNFSINQGPISASGFRQSDTRRVGLNIRYNFGLKKKEENNNMFNVEPPAQ